MSVDDDHNGMVGDDDDAHSRSNSWKHSPSEQPLAISPEFSLGSTGAARLPEAGGAEETEASEGSLGGDADGDAKPDAEVSLIGTLILGALLFAATVIGGIFLQRPFIEVEADRVSYSRADFMAWMFFDELIETKKAAAKARYGIDVSTIFPPNEAAAPEIVRLLETRCMPEEAGRPASVAMPHAAHQTFAVATEYLACTMKTKPKRLCEPDERRRFVGQLMQYRVLQQHLLGVEHAHMALQEEQQKGPMKKSLARIAAIADTLAQEAASPLPAVSGAASVGAEVDPRIAEGLALLNRRGLVSLSDFVWSFVFVPKEFAPYLTQAESELEGACDSF